MEIKIKAQIIKCKKAIKQVEKWDYTCKPQILDLLNYKVKKLIKTYFILINS